MITNFEADHIQAPPAELESPVDVADVQASATEIPGASLTSHLVPRHYLDHPDEAHEAAESLQAEIYTALQGQGLALPATLAEALAMQVQIRAGVPEDKRFKAIKVERLRQLAKHIHLLSQSPAPPKIDYHAFRLSVSAPRPEALAHFMGSSNKPRGKRG